MLVMLSSFAWADENTPAARIVSLSPNVTELLFAAGAGEKIVGVSAFSHYPEKAAKLPVVADSRGVNLEIIISLLPDLVVGVKGARNSVVAHKLEEFGISFVEIDITQLSDIPKAIAFLGERAGTTVQAERRVMQFNEEYAFLRSHYQGLRPVRVFFQMNAKPLLTVTHKTVIDEVIRLCGGRNIFSLVNGVAPMVSAEEVVARNPQVIVGTSSSKSWATQWRDWPELEATKRKAFVHVAPDLIERSGPRIMQGAKMLCEQIANLR